RASGTSEVGPSLFYRTASGRQIRGLRCADREKRLLAGAVLVHMFTRSGRESRAARPDDGLPLKGVEVLSAGCAVLTRLMHRTGGIPTLGARRSIATEACGPEPSIGRLPRLSRPFPPARPELIRR